jgi:hypothetical protein
MPLPFSCDPQLSVMIREICSPDPSERMIAAFAQVCIRLSIGSLRMFESGGYRVRDHGQAAGDIGTLAADCIADLFERNAGGEFVLFRRHFAPHLGRPLPEEEWFALLRRLVTPSARQGMFHIFRERDPESARLWRAVKRTARENPRYRLIETPFKDWICENRRGRGSGEIRFIHQLPDHAVPHGGSRSGFLPADPVPVLIEKTFAAFRDPSDGRTAVEIGFLVRLFRDYRRRMRKATADGPAEEPDFELRFETENVRKRLDAVTGRLSGKIGRDYVEKGKIDPDTAAGVRAALSKMLEDLADGGLTHSHFEYLREFLPGLDERRYRERLRTLFEYLVKLMKNDLKKTFF